MLERIRPVPKEKNVHRQRMYCLLCCAAGLLCGLLTQALELQRDMWAGPVFFLLVLVAVYSERPLFAACNTLAFFLCLSLNNYTYFTLALERGEPVRETVIRGLWVAAAAVFGFLFWAARGKSRGAVLLTALAAAIQLPIACRLLGRSRLFPALDLLLAAALLLLLQRDGKARLLSAALVLPAGAILICLFAR